MTTTGNWYGAEIVGGVIQTAVLSLSIRWLYRRMISSVPAEKDSEMGIKNEDRANRC